jgi:hypothetical protein
MCVRVSNTLKIRVSKYGSSKNLSVICDESDERNYSQTNDNTNSTWVVTAWELITG